MGIGERDRSGEQAGFSDPVAAGELAVAVQRVQAGGQRGLARVAWHRPDHRDARPDRAAPGFERAVAADQRGVADQDSGHVGDGVERPRLAGADGEP
jgi:hypothetical protein